MIPPKPASRPDKVSLWRYLRLFRQDILSAQPAKLYRAWMAEFKTPFFRSYLINQPELVKRVLNERPKDFPKSDRIGEGLRPLLGNSVFLTNGAEWKRQRRIIDPAFEGGRLRDTFPAIWAAGEAAVARITPHADGTPQEIEAMTSHAAADVIFRTLFSIPIENEIATEVFRKRDVKSGAQVVISPWHLHRQSRIWDNPDAFDPARWQTENGKIGQREAYLPFSAGPRVCTGAGFAMIEGVVLLAQLLKAFRFDMSKLRLSRDVFREALRLYPPVPMMVRETTCPETFRDRDVKPGAQVVISPWHLHRQTRLWDNPDGFDPARWATENGKQCMRDAFIPFSSGPRVCTGAGFAMVEGPLLLSMMLRHYRFELTEKVPVPVAHLTVRSKDGIWLKVSKRGVGDEV